MDPEVIAIIILSSVIAIYFIFKLVKTNQSPGSKPGSGPGSKPGPGPNPGPGPMPGPGDCSNCWVDNGNWVQNCGVDAEDPPTLMCSQDVNRLINYDINHQNPRLNFPRTVKGELDFGAVCTEAENSSPPCRQCYQDWYNNTPQCKDSPIRPDDPPQPLQPHSESDYIAAACAYYKQYPGQDNQDKRDQCPSVCDEEPRMKMGTPFENLPGSRFCETGCLKAKNPKNC